MAKTSLLTSYKIFEDQTSLFCGTTTRRGGVSEGPFSSLNLADNVGDQPSHVEENLNSLCQFIGSENLVWAEQVHGKEILLVSKAKFGSIGTGDILCTNCRGVPLMIKHADCQAAIFFDPTLKVLALVHAGWRGQMDGIYECTVNHLRDYYYCDPKNLLVSISPSLGPKHAEFVNFREEISKAYWDYQVQAEHFDLWAIAQKQMEECGILPGHLEISRTCTYEDPQNYFSFRRDGITGRHGTVAMIL